jgi:8-oxo-dGTP diphosphatase
MNAELPRHSVAVTGVVIDHQGRALLLQRPENGRREPPGDVHPSSSTSPRRTANPAPRQGGVPRRVLLINVC